jgi:NAD(P)-dependent dehydrogenase (short-subunit alcohol dehydrogenase family)
MQRSALDDKMHDSVIVVTGAAGVLGSHVTEVLSQAELVVVGIDKAQTIPHSPTLKLALGGVDLLDEKSTQSAFARIKEALGEIDGLVNIAGGFRWETVANGSVDTWDLLYQLNVRTAFVASHAALPLFRSSGGAIVNIGAAAARHAGLGMGAYAASKAGVARLTESLAEELKDKKIRVNAILPSIIDTPANRKEMADAAFDRWVTPASLAEVIKFLLSPAARDITGALIPVTGRV